MPRFFISKEQIADDTAYITGGDAHHIYSVLRMRAPEKLTVADFFGGEYLCEIVSADRERIALRILETRAAQSEPPFEITLLMALPKGDKMEWIVQKAVELGVTAILPFSSRYTVVKLDEKTAQKKTERWQKIAKSAAEQCGRGTVPKILPPLSFSAALKSCGDDKKALKFICYEGEEKRSLKDLFEGVPRPRQIFFAVGAEGGFDRAEVEAAAAEGFVSVTLGSRILRCETAPLAVLAQIAFAFEL